MTRSLVSRPLFCLALLISACSQQQLAQGGTQVWGVPVNSATTKEILLNFVPTPDIAKRAATTPLVIYTRPATALAGAMATLIMRVPDLGKAIEVKANGGTAKRPPCRMLWST